MKTLKRSYIGLFKWAAFIAGIILLLPDMIAGQSFNFVNKIISSDRDSIEGFGSGVSIYSGFAVAGSIGDTDDSLGSATQPGSGSAYVYKEDVQGYWHFFQKLTPFDRDSICSFGYSTSISGNYIVIGACEDSKDSAGMNNIGYGAGSAYIYKFANNHWSFIQKITAWDRHAGDRFGEWVSISGNRIAVSASGQDYDDAGSNYIQNAGAAYIFEPDANGHWLQKHKIVAYDRNINSHFSLFSGLDLDNNRLIISAPYDSYDTAGNNNIVSAGAAYIFECDTLTGVWSSGQKIAANDRHTDDWFGYSAAIEGNWAVTTSLNQTDSAGANPIYHAGAAYIFHRDSTGVWHLVQKICPHNRHYSDSFGSASDISGNNILIGAWQYFDSLIHPIGSAFVFTRDENSNHWSEVQDITASDPGLYDNFGGYAAIWNDEIIVGACKNSEDTTGGNYLNHSGSAYIYKWNFTSGIAENELTMPEVFAYPNPARNNFIFAYSFPKPFHSARLKLFNVQGVEVGIYNLQDKQGRKEIDVSGLASGVYFYSAATDGAATNARGRVVVMH